MRGETNSAPTSGGLRLIASGNLGGFAVNNVLPEPAKFLMLSTYQENLRCVYIALPTGDQYRCNVATASPVTKVAYDEDGVTFRRMSNDTVSVRYYAFG